MTEYCKYCGTLTNSAVKVYDKGRLVWVGCLDCRTKRNEMRNNATIKK